MSVVGVDGCRAGWIAVSIDERGGLESALHPDIESLHASLGCAAEVVLIDLPIGLPGSESFRACDRRARELLAPHRSASVFNPPLRALLDCVDHAEASALSRELCGKGISVQSFNILPKIREVDVFLRADRTRSSLYRECHPELVFRALAGGEALAESKRRAEGRARRISILEPELPGIDALLSAAMETHPRRDLAADDLLDAAALAWAAHRFGGDLVSLPEDGPRLDAEGLRMEILTPPVALD